jgi:ADP-heptose:LPS heptosyltransferase
VRDLVTDVGRIAVVRASALGEFVFSLPALYSLKAAYPGAELTLLGAPWHARALSGRPGPVDHVAVVPSMPGLRDGDCAPGELDAFLRWAAAEGFDIALQMHGTGRSSNPFVAALGARVTAGLRAPDAAGLHRCMPYVDYQPEIFRCLEVVGLVGAAPVTHQPVFELTERDHAQVRTVLGENWGQDRPWAVLHPGAADQRRRWPAERFAAVGDALAAAGVEILVTGTGRERAIVDAVCASMRLPARPVVDELTVPGLAALLAGSAVLIGGDSGPLHLAAAVGTRTVGLFWVGNMINSAALERTRHRPLISWTIRCPECGADCTRDRHPARAGTSVRGLARDPACRHAVSFIADIPVDEVVEEALDLLAAHRAEPALTRVP